jgi:hypothetical protein
MEQIGVTIGAQTQGVVLRSKLRDPLKTLTLL